MAGIDKGDTIGSMFIDLVDHRILIQTLAAYRLSRSSLLWFISYLESRQQTIQYDRGMTKYIIRLFHRAQYWNQRYFSYLQMTYHCYCDLFADDATIHTSSSDKNTINEEI